jgi:hypothetical protein
MAIQIIKPDLDKAFNPSIFVREMEIAVSQTMQVVDSDFAKTTRTWQTQVLFTHKGPFLQDGDLVGEVVTENQIYKFVDQGTAPHDIYPKRARVLRFNSTFKPKTRPNVIGSSGGLSAPPEVFAAHVHHPGTQARNFTKEIARRRARTLATFAKAAAMRAAKAMRS